MKSIHPTKIWEIIYGVLFLTALSTQLYAQPATPSQTPARGADVIRLCSEYENEIKRKETRAIDRPTFNCAYKRLLSGGGSNHEPPIGFGGGSAFLDLPIQITLERNGKEKIENQDYYKYKVIKNPEIEHNPHLTYKEILGVLVMTEEVIVPEQEGEVSVLAYNFAERTNARLKVWLAKATPAQFSDPADIIIYGEGGGAILSKKKLDRKKLGKQHREYRFVRSKSKLRVVKWQLTGNGVAYSDDNDDLYYFYIEFDHN